jgi:uncharacterized repeat protein (TIGR01451 family)
MVEGTARSGSHRAGQAGADRRGRGGHFQVACKRGLWLALLLTGAAQAAPGTDLLVNMNQVPSQGQGPAGGNFQYETIVLHNTGGAATGVTLASELPIGAVFVSASSPDGVTCSVLPAAQAVVDATNSATLCEVGNVEVDGSKRVVFTVVLPSERAGWITRSTVQHDDSATDPNRTNDASFREFTTYAAADLRITATATPDGIAVPGSLRPGQPYEYAIDVTNVGPTAIPAAGRTQVKFDVPEGVSITGIDGSTGWTCAPNTYPLTSYGGGTPNVSVTCERPGAVAANNGQTPQLVLKAMSNTLNDTTAAFNVKGYSNATTEMPDGQPDNNTTAVTVRTAGTGADMSITKTANTATVAVGENVTYTLRPRFNGGILLATDVLTVTDPMAAGLTLVSAAGTGWTCSTAGGAVSCTRTVGATPPTPPSNLDAITVVATVTGAAGGRSNTASIAEPNPSGDPDTNNNASTVLVQAATDADLSVSKGASNYQQGVNVPVPVNTAFNYTLNARNNGPLNIPAGTDFTLVDSVPAGITIQGVTPGAGWTCDPLALPAAGPTTVTCHYAAALNNGATTTNVVLAALRTTTGNVTNNACVAYPAGSSRTDANTTNNCRGVGVAASTDIQPNDLADVAVTKGFSAGPTYAGDNLTYTLTVDNRGPALAKNVVLLDTLGDLLSSNAPANLRGFQGAVFPAGVTCTFGGTSLVSGVTTVHSTRAQLRCELGDIPNGQSRTVTVTVRPAVDKTKNRDNTAHAFAQDSVDPDLTTNNQATVSSPVIARVDLVASKTATPTTAAGGELITYTAAVSNNGPSLAQNVWLRDELPEEAVMIGDPAPTQGGVCTLTGRLLECVWDRAAGPGTVNDYLAVSARYEVVYQMRSINNVPWVAGRTLENTVEVGTLTDEPNLTNNQATAVVALTPPELDVLVAMSHSADAINLGSETVYTIRVTNTGPSYGTNVVMTNTFPATNSNGDASSATFSYEGALTLDDPSLGSCTGPALGATLGSVQCSFPLMAPNESRTITFKMKAQSLPAGAASGTIFHQAVVSVAETEQRTGVDVLANNTTHDQTTTRRAPPAPGALIDLGIDKTTDPAAVRPGDSFDYVLTVTNHSAAGRDVLASHGAQVLDTLPAGLRFVAAPGCVYDGTTRVVSCGLLSLAGGGTQAWTVTVEVENPYAGGNSLDNTARVEMPGDPEPGNDTSTVTKKVTPPAVVAVPTLSQWSLLLMSILMAWLALRQGGRKRQR